MNKYNSWSNSSFWLDEDFTSSGTSIFDDIADVKPKGIDLLKLAGYRRAIANFVSIVTGESIPVSFSGTDSYTNGKVVNISAKLNDNEFDPAVGLALHEGSHIKLTDFNVMKEMEGRIPTPIYDMILEKYYSNKEVEDQVWMTKNYIMTYVRDLLNIVEDRRIDNFVYKSAPGYRGYYESLYNKYFNSKIVDKGLQSDEYTEMDWDSYMFRIINITNTNRRLDIMNFRTIWNILDLKNINRLKSSQDALDVAYQIFEFVESQLPKPIANKEEENCNCAGEGEGDAKEGFKDGDEIPSTKISDEDFEKVLEEYDKAFPKDDGSKAEGEEAKKSGGNMPDLSPRQIEQLKKAIAKQKDFLNEDIKKKKLSKKDARSMKAMEESGIELEEVKYDREMYSGEKFTAKQNVYVIKNVTQTLIDSEQFPEMFSNYHYSLERQRTAIKEGLVLGKMLGKKLKVRAEQRDTKFNRLRSGKIDNRMLASCGYGNESIFEKIESFAYNPGMLHISIDNSGSMNSTLAQAMKTTMAIAKACSMIENMDVVVSFRSADHVGGGREYMPVIGMIYDSRKDHLSKLVKIMPQVRACGTTPEGLCFAAIMKEIVKDSRGKDSYFVNMCDGMPWFNGYGGEAALDHTRRQVVKMRKEGIKVISYFIGQKRYGGEEFQRMYGKDSQFINTNNLVSLAKTMNNKFLQKI